MAAYSDELGEECVDKSVDLPTPETSHSSSSETGPPLKKPRVARSDVWDFFEKLPDADKKVRCMLCHPQKEFAFHGGTTNLREHLSSKHPLEYKAETKKQTTLFDYTKHSRCSEARNRNITSLISDMVAIDLRPLRLVEGEGFKKLMEYLEPGYKVPSAMHMASLIHRKYKAGYEKLKEILKVDPSAVSLTTDLWTSIANDSFITVSAHFISPDWDMCSVVLCTSAFPERHTGAEISQKLINIAEEFEISEKVACIVHDQGLNMVLTMKLLSDEKGWNTLRCSAHCLQLSINAGLSSVSVIDRMIGAAKKLVGHFRHSVVASEALKQRQEQMGIPQKKLVQSCLTRWNSIYEMMLRLLEMRWSISAVIIDETVTKRVYRYLDLKSEQWTLMEELVEVLKPLKVATTFLQYEHNSSLSCILPIIHGLDLSLQPTSDYSTSVQQFKERVRQEIRVRWELENLDPTSVDVLASALDPRFKQLKYLNDDQRIAVKEEITRRMTCQSSLSSEPQALTTSRSEKTTALDILLGPEEASQGFLTCTEEFDTYLAEKPVARETQCLKWWKENSFRFPRLAEVTKSLLCIPATSAPAERLFSNAGLTVNRLRSSLNPDTVNALVVLNKNHSFLNKYQK